MRQGVSGNSPDSKAFFKSKGKFERRVMLASPTMHNEEKTFIDKAFDEGFAGRNIARLEKKRQNTLV